MNRLILVTIFLLILAGITTGCATAPRTTGTAKTAAPTQNADGSQSMTLGQAVGAILKSIFTVRVDVYGADDPNYPGRWRNSPNLSYSHDHRDDRHHHSGAFNEGYESRMNSLQRQAEGKAFDAGRTDGKLDVRPRTRFASPDEALSYRDGYQFGQNELRQEIENQASDAGERRAEDDFYRHRR